MPIQFVAKLGSNTFEADGEFLFDDGFNTAFRSWINAQQTTDGSATTLELITDRLHDANEAAEDVVAANTPNP